MCKKLSTEWDDDKKKKKHQIFECLVLKLKKKHLETCVGWQKTKKAVFPPLRSKNLSALSFFLK